MNGYLRSGSAFGLAIMVLLASVAQAASDGVSYAASGPVALFVFHFDNPLAGRYSITHLSERGGLTTEVYRFAARGPSDRVVISLTKSGSSCGSFRATITPRLLRLSVSGSRFINLTRVTDKDLATHYGSRVNSGKDCSGCAWGHNSPFLRRRNQSRNARTELSSRSTDRKWRSLLDVRYERYE
jgi:hypothetical protein